MKRWPLAALTVVHLLSPSVLLPQEEAFCTKPFLQKKKPRASSLHGPFFDRHSAAESKSKRTISS
jgi:hypothetical protein